MRFGDERMRLTVIVEEEEEEEEEEGNNAVSRYSDD